MQIITSFFFEVHANHNTALFVFSSPSSLYRCEWTGLMKLLPSMPLAQQHRAPMPTAGWILALALLLALQVKFVPTKWAVLSE